MSREELDQLELERVRTILLQMAEVDDDKFMAQLELVLTVLSKSGTKKTQRPFSS